ncbi:MAG: sel1 repeat family protein [Myxococcales bacterium]|nr:MAG: sel1 repeat family protein [Myxococcales bacterium]
MRRSFIPLLCALAGACSHPVPASGEQFVGLWTAADRYLAISADGRLEYQRKSGGNTVELGGVIRSIDSEEIRTGIWPISSTFKVDRAPHLDGDQWKMTIDGVELSRTEADGAEGPGSEAALLEECAAGRAPSCSMLAVRYATGEAPDLQRAFQFAQTACKLGDAKTCAMVGEMYLAGSGVLRDVDAAQAALDKACTQTVARACFNLATLYLDGSLPKDLEKAAELNQRACDGGDADGCHNLALAYQEGTGISKDLPRALTLLQRACGIDPAVSCAYLGSLYQAGEVVERDGARAVELYRRACGVKEPTGCYNLAANLLEGKLLDRDLPLAARLFEHVCETEHTAVEGTTPRKLSCHNLGVLHASGEGGVPRSLERAAALFGTACDLGYLDSCHNVGMAYMTGEGVVQDLPKAALIFQNACAAGLARSCTNLGHLYREGRGVKQDSRKAAELFTKGCGGGSAKGCRAGEVVTL